LFGMESEEEYLAEHNHRKAVYDLCRERDRFPASDPRRSKIQSVLDHADEFEFGQLYGFLAQLKLVEITEMEAQQKVHEAISNLSSSGILREIEINKSLNEHQHLMNLGYTNLHKAGGRWVEGDDDDGWEGFTGTTDASQNSGETEAKVTPPTIKFNGKRVKKR